mgnify:CR=1 FL=1
MSNNSHYKSFPGVDPSYGSGQGSSRKDLFEMVDRRAKEILDADVCNKYKAAVNKAKDDGLIVEYDARDIELIVQAKPWREVNKTIRNNESRNNATSASADPS